MLAFASRMLGSKSGISRNAEVKVAAIVVNKERAAVLASKRPASEKPRLGWILRKSGRLTFCNPFQQCLEATFCTKRAPTFLQICGR